MRMNRSQSSLFRRTLITLTGALAISSLPVTSYALDYYINTGDDTPIDASSNSRDCDNPCSLRAAIRAANFNAGADTIYLGDFDIALFINGSEENAALTGDLDITDNLIIVGEKNVSRNTIDATGLGDRVFHIIGAAEVSMTNIEITRGSVVDGGGGGINVRDNGHIILDNVELRSNIVTAGLATFETTGGGLYVGINATAVVTNSSIVQNSAPAGGGINNAGRLEIRDTLIDDNKTNKPLNGGAINNAGGYLVIGNSTITNNSSKQSGGALYSANLGENIGSIVVTNTEFSNNLAAAQGGAIANFGPLSINNSTIKGNDSTFDGGGIYNSGIGSIDIVNSTISSNSGRSGGGLFTTRTASLSNTTVYNNFSSPCTIGCDAGSSGNGLIGGNQLAVFAAGGASRPNLALSNTIISDGPDSNPNTPPCAGDTGYLSFINTEGHNLENDDSCGLVSNSPINDLPNVFSAYLGDLAVDAAYPTTTPVHPLLTGSPAIDKASNSTCPLVDQRFLVRDDLCDIGSYEEGATEQQIGGLVDLKVTIIDSPDPVAPNNDNQPLTYSIAITNLYVDDSAEGVIVEIQLPDSFWFQSLSSNSASSDLNAATPNCQALNSENTIICNVSSIPGLGRVEFYVSGQPTAVGTITLTVNVWSTTVDAYLLNNRDVKEETTVSNEADDTDNFGGNGSDRRGGGSNDLLLLFLTTVTLVSRRYFKR